MDKIICLGKNYPLHAQEMKEGVPEVPAIFCKPPSVYQEIPMGKVLSVPWEEGWGEIHHELEVVFEVKQDCYRLPSLHALEEVFSAVALGLDMTKRDLQGEMKKKGWPWELGKVFPNSALVGPRWPLSFYHELKDQPFTLHLNGELRQQGLVSQMGTSPLRGVELVSRYFPLKKGDLFFTGTPHGVGPVNKGEMATLTWGGRVLQVTWV